MTKKIEIARHRAPEVMVVNEDRDWVVP